jgi:predicted ATPase
MLQRLAVFSGSFSLAAARAVTGSKEASEAEIADGLATLVAKSLVTSDIDGEGGSFRLLETTRAYALSKLTESGELHEVSRRHADYYRMLLETIENEWEEKRSIPLAHLDNVRAALEWCFGDDGDPATGARLAATAAPGFLAMSLLPECHRWSERGIRALDDLTRGGPREMHLQASLGVSSMQMRGESDAARAALSRSLAIAEAHGDVLNQVGLLGMLSMFEVRDGDFRTSLHYARLSRAVEGTAGNSAAMALANSILGRALQFVGEHDNSRRELEASFRYWSRARRTSEVYLGLDHHILVGIGLARNLWLQGHPAQATERVRQTIKEAEHKNHPASLGLALSWAPGIFLWNGDFSSAEEQANRLRSHARSHSLGPYLAVARGYEAMLAIGRGEAAGGVEKLRGCFGQFHAMRYEMLNTDFKLSLARGLVAMGEFREALTQVDETIRLVEANGDLLHMPEALRVKGNVLLSMPQHGAREAETCFVQSLDWSRRQAARSWELRTAVDLAALWAAHGRRNRAQALLQPIFESFDGGLESADLKAAEHLLATLR